MRCAADDPDHARSARGPCFESKSAFNPTSAQSNSASARFGRIMTTRYGSLPVYPRDLGVGNPVRNTPTAAMM
jgi:hypothetical protein